MKIARYALLSIVVCAVPATLLCAIPATVLAGKKAGVTMPDSIKVAGKTLVLNGMGLREATVFKVDVYVVGLYVESKSADGDAIAASRQVKRLHLRFVRDVDRDDMTEAWDNGFKKVASDLDSLKKRIKTLEKWTEDVDDGKSLILTYVPDKGVELEINGKIKGTIEGDDFAQALFSIWLGKKSPYGGMRSGLLGK